MQGEINVDQVLREQKRLEAFRETMAVREEIRVLFEWWNLVRAARKAEKAGNRSKQRTIALDQLHFKRLFGPELDRAMKKWNLAMAERAELAKRRRPPRALGVARSDWPLGASPSASPALRPATSAVTDATPASSLPLPAARLHSSSHLVIRRWA